MLHWLQGCSCVRHRAEDIDSRDAVGSTAGSRRPVVTWGFDQAASDGCYEDTLGPQGYMLPLPSMLLAPTSGISMEPMAVRGDRSWSYASKLPVMKPLGLSGPLQQLPSLLMSDALPLPSHDFAVSSPAASMGRCNVGRQAGMLPAPETPVQEARDLLRTMLSPASLDPHDPILFADSSGPSPHKVLVLSPTKSEEPRGLSAPPAIRQQHPVSPATVHRVPAAPHVVGSPISPTRVRTIATSGWATPPFASPSERNGITSPQRPISPARVGTVSKSGLATPPFAFSSERHRTTSPLSIAPPTSSGGMPLASVGIDANRNGNADYFYVGRDMNHNGIPDALEVGAGLPEQDALGKTRPTSPKRTMAGSSFVGRPLVMAPSFPPMV